MLGPSVLYSGWSRTANLGGPTASSGNCSLVAGRKEGRAGTLSGAQLLLPPRDWANDHFPNRAGLLLPKSTSEAAPQRHEVL